MEHLSQQKRGAENDSPISFGSALRTWRRHRGLSQLELALEAGISSRHLSFLETGRSEPSREMVYLLLDTLEVPLRNRNQVLLSAGYAPVYSDSKLEGQQAASIRKAVQHLLKGHLPYPAYAIDGAWNVINSNQSFRQLLAEIGPGPDPDDNILRLFFAPDLLRPFVVNWSAPARTILSRVQKQMQAPQVSGELAAIYAEIQEYPGVEEVARKPVDPAAFDLFIPITIRFQSQELRCLTTIITFSGALDVTLSELVVECFYPADDETEAFFSGLQLLK